MNPGMQVLNHSYEEIDGFSDLYRMVVNDESHILRWFLILLIVFAGVRLYINGMYHIVTLICMGLIFEVTGIRNFNLSVAYDIIKSCALLTTIDYLILDRKKYNVPVYIAVSNKNILINNPFLRFIGLNRHWAVVVPTEHPDQSYCVFDARGTLLVDMKSKLDFMYLERARIVFQDFYPMGLTTRERISMLFRKKLKKAFTCGQYCHLITNFLVYPYSPTHIYGRSSYLLIICVMTFLFVANIFSNLMFFTKESWWWWFFWIDFDMVYILYLVLDIFSVDFEDGMGSEKKCKPFDVIVSSFSFLVLTILNGRAGGRFNLNFNGSVYLAVLISDLMIRFIFLPKYVPAFPVVHKNDSARFSDDSESEEEGVE